MRAVTSIMRAHQILIAELDGRLRRFGLTFSRYEALVLLSFTVAYRAVIERTEPAGFQWWLFGTGVAAGLVALVATARPPR